MSKRMHGFMIAAVGLGWLSTPAWATFDGQLLLGQRFGEWQQSGATSSVKAREVTLAGHYSPLALFSAGVFFTSHDYSVSKSANVAAFDELEGYQLGVELTGRFPLKISDLSLYGRLGYGVYGRYEGAAVGVQRSIPETGETE